MVQLLPTVRTVSSVSETKQFPIRKRRAWSLHPISLINFFILDKEVDASLFSGVRFFFGRDLHFSSVCTWDKSAFLASVHGSITLREEINTCYQRLIVIGLTVALGRHTPYLLVFAGVCHFSVCSVFLKNSSSSFIPFLF